MYLYLFQNEECKSLAHTTQNLRFANKRQSLCNFNALGIYKVNNYYNIRNVTTTTIKICINLHMKFSINNFTNTNFDRNIKFQKVIKCTI